MAAIMIVVIAVIWGLVKYIKKETNRLTDNEAAVDRQTGDHTRHADTGKPGRRRNSRKRFCMGKVVWYDENRLFGFIRQQYSKGGRIFFHKSDVKGTKNIRAGLRVEYKLVNTQRGVKAISVKLTSDNKCVRNNERQENKLQGLNCIQVTEGNGCVTLQDFKLSLHLYESYIDGEVELNEINEHISCRCQTNDIARSSIPR